MGYHIHHTIVCTTWEEKHLAAVHAKAKELFPFCVSEIVKGQCNGYSSFFIAPDGSKEGWKESDQYNERRSKFKEWLRETNSDVDWAEVAFGGDESYANTHILDHDGYEERDS